MIVHLSDSKHFKLEQLAEGVYAAIAIPDGAAFSNAGIVDLGDRTLIFDTFETPQAAEDLRAAVEQLTGRPATYVINSHAHSDHWAGNQVFSGATIIATHTTRGQMGPVADDMLDCLENPELLEEMLQEDLQLLEHETHLGRRAILEQSIIRTRFSLEFVVPILEIILPNQTFEGKLTFYGSHRKAELLEPGFLHSPGDAILVLPQERIAFMGDVAFFNRQPYMPESNPQDWKEYLEQIEQADIEIFVPGHGQVGTRADIIIQRQYHLMLEEMVVQALQRGDLLEKTLRQPIPEPFDTWESEMARSENNLRFLYEHLFGEKEI